MTGGGPRFARDPAELLTPAQLAELSGRAFLEGIRDGRLPAPPIAEPMGMRLVEVGDGRVVFEGRPGFSHYNPLGSVHGGWFGTILDSCMACAVQSRLPKGQGYTTLEYRVNILRAVTAETGVLRAVGEAVRVGRRTGVAEGRLLDEAGRICATGSTTCLVFAIEEA
ncbi:PaaI family thioesterase [Paralimibaculum aggregatum]|uniref:PaaI family thioesterase n=1 Tax=Paralimibaculum aggregatum TaxID=3036245 RepID=A0ABQ6LGR1_9RHOB|nr:PaaI family thioesterase [Limibaculum sp. NKW23]GMG81264.1 PaaI family thioesterase [Limibaculum sp. NKW23]